jgi:outer membrane protein OmpA-like peptidoglycan-associated protein
VPEVLTVATSVPPALDLPGFDASIDLDTCELEVVIENDAIGFDKGSDLIRPDGRTKLAAVADALAGADEVVVIGHTSTEGSAEANLDLSRRRAAAVIGVLEPAVPGADFRGDGRGEEQPIVVPDDTEEQRAHNRRVEVRAEVEAEVCS